MSYPVSVQICTLNEGNNIAACLESVKLNEPDDILVIDGGSTDETVAIARALGVRVIESDRPGLAHQRRLGYESVKTQYVAFVDADDRLPEAWLKQMITFSSEGEYAALQSSLRVKNPKGFWERGWNQYFIESIVPASDVHMVGRPALFRTTELQLLPQQPDVLVEDTQMSRDFESRGLRQGIAATISYRLCPDSYSLNRAKWRNYGLGYRQFVTKHPSRKRAILRHILWVIPVERSFRPVLRGQVLQPVFNCLMSWNILRGYFGSAHP